MTTITAKANNATVSTAVVVSFDARWRDLIYERKIRIVLRKRVPRSSAPKSMYIYVNSPHSLLLARAPIQRITTLTSSEALLRQSQLLLTADQIRDYFQGAAEVGAYTLGPTEVAQNPLPLVWLQRTMAFTPPQSFFFLAPEARQAIDRAAIFSGRSSS